MNWGKIIISTILGGIVILIISIIVGQIATLVNPQYNLLSLGGMRAVDDPIMVLFFFHPFVLALAFSIAFHFFQRSFTEPLSIRRGIHFGLLMWMLVTLPSVFLIYSSMDYGETFLLAATVGQLIEFCAAGIFISWIFTRK